MNKTFYQKEGLLLIAEDDEDHIHLIKRSLKEVGLFSNDIFWVKNGQDVLDFVNKKGKFINNKMPIPNLILLDVKMPMKNGFEVLEELKRNKATKAIPVIMLTTTSASEDIERAVSLGAEDFIVKPIKNSDFTKKIATLGRYWHLSSEFGDKKTNKEQIRSLIKNETILKEAQEIANMGHWDLDITTNFLSWSDEVFRIFGIKPSEFNNTIEDFFNRIHPDDIDFTKKEYWNSIENNTPFQIEHRIIKPNGNIRYVQEKCVHFFDNAGKPIRSLGTILDITEHIETVKALKKSKENFKNLVEFSPNGIIIHNEKKFLFANKTFLEIFSCTKLECLNKNTSPEKLFLSQFNQKAHARRISIVKKGRSVPFMEFTFSIPSSQEKIRLEIKPILINYNDEEVIQLVFRNISEKKKLKKEQLRAHVAEESNLILQKEVSVRKKTEKKLRESLDEKEILFKEVHHRVKNNMQIISSMFNLQMSNIKNETVRKTFKESQDRIQAMALVHENLYQTKDFNKIRFDDYIRKLVDNLFRTYEVDSSKISLEFKIDNVKLPMDICVPCGLIINELVSNSIKHAFKKKNRGYIRIELLKIARGKTKLIVSDNGDGIKYNIDEFADMNSLGLQLVTALAGQINAKLLLENNKGSKFIITL